MYHLPISTKTQMYTLESSKMLLSKMSLWVTVASRYFPSNKCEKLKAMEFGGKTEKVFLISKNVISYSPHNIKIDVY